MGYVCAFCITHYFGKCESRVIMRVSNGNMVRKMRLTDQERALIKVIGVRGDLPLTEIGALVGLPTYTVRHALSRLIEREYVRRAVIVDTFLLGWIRFNIFFSMSLQESASKSRVIHQLMNFDRTAYLAEATGDFDYEVSLLARSSHDMMQIMRRISDRFEGVFFAKSISNRVRIVLFPRKYLSDHRTRIEALAVGGTDAEVAIDSLDHRILAQLDAYPFDSLREVARRLSVAPSTVEKRVAQLKERRVIVGTVYSTNPALYGCISHTILIFTRGFSSELRKSLFSWAREHPHITSFVECFGAWDFELGVEFERADQLVALRESIAQQFGQGITTIRTVVKLKTYRYSSYPMRREPSSAST